MRGSFAAAHSFILGQAPDGAESIRITHKSSQEAESSGDRDLIKSPALRKLISQTNPEALAEGGRSLLPRAVASYLMLR